MGGFSVAPGKVGKIKVTTVCLEHGKEDPNPRIPYEIKKIEEFNKNPEVAELCKLLGTGKISQSAAQAAAWHLTDGLTPQQLASKVKVRHLNGSTEMYFTRQQLQLANRILVEVKQRVAKAKKDEKSQSEDVSPGDLISKELAEAKKK